MRTSPTKFNLTAWANRVGIEPQAAHTLQKLANKAFDAEDKGRTQATIDRTTRQFEEFAFNLGFQTRWPGLWPVLVRNGDEIHLPD